MAKLTIVLALIALFALAAARPQDEFPGGSDAVNVVDGDNQVNIVDGDHQVDIVDGPSGPTPRDGSLLK